MTLAAIFAVLLQKGGSDLHIRAGSPPRIRVMGKLIPFPPEAKMDRAAVTELLCAVLTPQQVELLKRDQELDFSLRMEGMARFRANYFYHLGNLGATFRVIPEIIPTIEALALPSVLKDLATRKQGLILITGPTGAGKSTTLAALIHHVNKTEAVHVITIEDPVEFLHQDLQAQITQREVGADTRSYSEALRRALRQDPDVIMVGEMRDAESIGIAMTAAETGHLVLSTLHTNDSRQSIDRILDVFPHQQQNQIRMQLSLVLVAIISQRLLRRTDGSGRIAAMEVMVNTPTMRRLIADGKMEGIPKAIEEGSTLYKMQSLNQHLLSLLQEGLIAEEEALAVSTNPNDLKILITTRSRRETDPKKYTSPPSLAAMGGIMKGKI
ncbi:MAG: PilT/PilU family type 4a pilus ATPase [Nitrospirae bacterium]|nr:PilT/PilU family type 4a pilus ATPase [Candidatus Troglogloeales bacterium]